MDFFGDSGLSIDEDSGDHINLTPDDPDVVTNYQTLSYSVESDKPDLAAYIENIQSSGLTSDLRLSIQEDDQNGTANITVSITDSTGVETIESFLLTIDNVNDLPILSLIPSDSDLNVDEDGDLYYSNECF